MAQKTQNRKIAYLALYQTFVVKMFFKLQDIKCRHNSTCWTNNITAWHTSVEFTPSWNYQRGTPKHISWPHDCSNRKNSPAIRFALHLPRSLHVSALLASHWFHPMDDFHQTYPQLGIILKRSEEQNPARIHNWSNRHRPQVALLRQFNSGWFNSFGGFQLINKESIQPSWQQLLSARLLPSQLTWPLELIILIKISRRNYKKDIGTYGMLQKNPFEEGSCYLFKDTFSLLIKHSKGPFTAFICYDWLIGSFYSFGEQLACQFSLSFVHCRFLNFLRSRLTYPYAVTAWEMLEIRSNKDGVGFFAGNYQKASVYDPAKKQSFSILDSSKDTSVISEINPMLYVDGQSLCFWLKKFESSNIGRSMFSVEQLKIVTRKALNDQLFKCDKLFTCKIKDSIFLLSMISLFYYEFMSRMIGISQDQQKYSKQKIFGKIAQQNNKQQQTGCKCLEFRQDGRDFQKNSLINDIKLLLSTLTIKKSLYKAGDLEKGQNY